MIRHTVSLLTDHIDSLFPKYRGKVLEGEVAEAPGKLSGFHLLLSRFKLFMSPQKWYIKNKKIKNRKTFFIPYGRCIKGKSRIPVRKCGLLITGSVLKYGV